MDPRWFEDMMSQNFNEDICFNPSKLLLLQFMTKGGTIQQTYKRIEFQEYLYRVYIDNPEISSKHPNYIIRHLGTYGVKDLDEHVSDIFESWERDAKNGVLRSGEHYFMIQVSLEDAIDIAQNTSRLTKMLYKKMFGGTIPDVHSMSEIIELDDHNIDVFGQSLFRNRVFEDMQYCPICEEINMTKLYCVHIFEKRMGAKDEELIDKANGLIFCKSHAEDFINNEFSIDELGFVKGCSGYDIESGMHLSFSIRNSTRKYYLKKRNERY